MQSFRSRLSKSSILGQVENSVESFGLSFDFLDKPIQLISRENKPVYRPLRKNYFMPFKDELCFVHKKPKIHRKKSKSNHPRSQKISPDPKVIIPVKYPSPIFRIFKEPRSTTPAIEKKEVKAKEEEKETIYSPVKPKIIIKRKPKTVKLSQTKKCEKIEDFGEIDAWESDFK